MLRRALSKHFFELNQRFIKQALRQAQGERLFIEMPLCLTQPYFVKQYLNGLPSSTLAHVQSPMQPP